MSSYQDLSLGGIYSGNGLFACSHVCYYDSSTDKTPARKDSLFGRLVGIGMKEDGNLQDFFEDKAIGIHEHLEAIRQVCCGLSQVHSSGRIFGNLTLTTIVFNKAPQLRVGLKGLGCVFDENEKHNLPARFSEGLYGCITATAPEMLGEFPFTGDYKRAEMWAFGHMLFECIFEKPLSWDADLREFSTTNDVSKKQELQGRILEKMKTMIDIERRQLQQSPFTPSTLLKLWICDLLSFDPELRPTIDQALTKINELLRY